MKRRLMLQTNHISPYADTYVEAGSPTTNFSNSINLVVKTEGSYTRRSYLQFKSNNFTKYTKLRLYIYNQSGGQGFINISVDLMPNVDLTTLTYSNEPSPITSSVANFTSTVNGVFTLVDLPLLATFSGDTITLRLRGTVGSQKSIVFASKEYGQSVKPILL